MPTDCITGSEIGFLRFLRSIRGEATFEPGCFGIVGGVNYLRLFAGVIVVFISMVPPANSVPVSGVVRSKADQSPIAGAEVRVESATQGVVASMSGTFSIDLPAGIMVTLAAGKFGFINSSIRLTPSANSAPVVIRLEPLASGPPLSNPFHDPSVACTYCHAYYYEGWSGAGSGVASRHATAGSNTWVRDLVDGSGTGGGLGQPGYVFKRDSTSLAAGNPYTTGLCAECHLPLLSSLLPEDTPAGARVDLSDAAASSPEGSLERLAYDAGVACEVCHKTESVQQANGEFGRTGFFGKAKLFANDDGVQFGPLPDSDVDIPHIMRAAYNPLHTESRLCAACHEYRMDHDFDGDFDEAGSPPGQTTYSEWLSSSYAQRGVTCQKCHMSPDGDQVDIGVGGPSRSPSQIHNHRFEGATLSRLQRAADVILDATAVAGALQVQAEVRNVGAGHNFPTGFTTRNVILAVTATTNLGQSLVWSSSGTDLVPAWGGVGDEANDYGLKPGRGFARILYGRGEVEGTTQERVIFIDALGEVSNTAIPPKGKDVSHYLFSLEGIPGDIVTVTATLVYRRVWKDLAEEKGWTLDGQGQPYGDLLVEQVHLVVPINHQIEPTPTSTQVEPTPTPTLAEPTPTPTRHPDSCDLVVDGRADAKDLIAYLRDRAGVEDFPTDFNGKNGEDVADLFEFAQFWYQPPPGQ